MREGCVVRQPMRGGACEHARVGEHRAEPAGGSRAGSRRSAAPSTRRPRRGTEGLGSAARVEPVRRQPAGSAPMLSCSGRRFFPREPFRKISPGAAIGGGREKKSRNPRFRGRGPREGKWASRAAAPRAASAAPQSPEPGVGGAAVGYRGSPSSCLEKRENSPAAIRDPRVFSGLGSGSRGAGLFSFCSGAECRVGGESNSGLERGSA